MKNLVSVCSLWPVFLKAEQTRLFIFFLFLTFDIWRNNCEIDMYSPINYFSQYASLAGKSSLQNKSRTNQVCEVRLILGLKFFGFREYGPIRPSLQIDSDACKFTA